MNKKELVPIALILAAVVLSIYVYPLLPDTVAIHWNASGQANGYSSKLFHVLLFPGIILFMYALFEILPRIEVFRKNLQSFSKHFFAIKVALLSFFVYVYVLATAANLGYTFNFGIWLMPALGLLFVIIGYAIQFAKRNFFVGIRTPWTMASDTVWKKTHKAGSKVFIGLGVWTALIGFIFPPKWLIWVMIVPLAASVVWMFWYSYALYKKESNNFKKEPKL